MSRFFFSALNVCGTVSSWILNSNEEKRYRKFYRYLQRLGRFDERIQNAYESWLIGVLKDALQKENVVRLALDDSPIKRYDPQNRGRGLCAIRLIRSTKKFEPGVFVSTDLNATPQEILLEYSRRFSIEETSKDLKEEYRQEVRKWESCKACATITAMGFTFVEIETWKRNASELTALRPRWDDTKRRPSHKNKRDWIARKIAFENFSRNTIGAKPEDIQKEILRLASLLGLAV